MSLPLPFLSLQIVERMRNFKKPHTLRVRMWGGWCIMVAHVVYVVVSLPAGSAEMTLASIAAIAGHIAGRTAAEGAAIVISKPCHFCSLFADEGLCFTIRDDDFWFTGPEADLQRLV